MTFIIGGIIGVVLTICAILLCGVCFVIWERWQGELARQDAIRDEQS